MECADLMLTIVTNTDEYWIVLHMCRSLVDFQRFIILNL
jgi:hypothetical protein